MLILSLVVEGEGGFRGCIHNFPQQYLKNNLLLLHIEQFLPPCYNTFVIFIHSKHALPNSIQINMSQMYEEPLFKRFAAYLSGNRSLDVHGRAENRKQPLLFSLESKSK